MSRPKMISSTLLCWWRTAPLRGGTGSRSPARSFVAGGAHSRDDVVSGLNLFFNRTSAHGSTSGRHVERIGEARSGTELDRRSGRRSEPSLVRLGCAARATCPVRMRFIREASTPSTVPDHTAVRLCELGPASTLRTILGASKRLMRAKVVIDSKFVDDDLSSIEAVHAAGAFSHDRRARQTPRTASAGSPPAARRVIGRTY